MRASQGKHGFCYTHKPLTKRNIEIIKEMSCDSFCINVSCEGLSKADAISDLALPLVTVVSKDLPEDWRTVYTPAGRKVMRCPATWLVRNGQKVQCATCGGSKGPMCNWKDRDFIIGFDPHGFTNKIEEACNAEQARFEKTGKLY